MALLAPPPPPKPKSFLFHPKTTNTLTITANSLHYPTNSKLSNNSLNFSLLSNHKNRATRIKTSIACAASVPLSGEGKDSNFGRILLSDVVVKRKRNVFWCRKWKFYDAAVVSVVVAMHLLCLFAPFTFSWGAFAVSVGFYVVTGLLGITLSFHRNLSHRSFQVPKWLEYFFAYCGVQALQVSFRFSLVCVAFRFFLTFSIYLV